MTHPEWALKFKTKNTDVRCIRGKYYLYATTSKWDPEKQRTKKVTLKYIGSISEEYGLIPSGMKRRGPIPAGESVFKTDPKLETNFIDSFDSLEDPRSLRNRLYSWTEILLLSLCAIICGAEGWQDIENFGKAKIEYLRQFFDYTNGIPSDDTIRRFFRSLNPETFTALFREWVENLAKTIDIKVIAIDGKSSRHSFDTEKNMLHTLSAFATEARIVLGQEKVDSKSNEITAIPRMLGWLDVKGHIVTIDAMGCQYAIADQIMQKEGDYIFSLKGNQGTLSKDVKSYFEDNNLKKSKSYTESNTGHGRAETRECTVVTDVQWLRDMHTNWQTIQSIIEIKSSRKIDNKSTEETRYYISSLQDTPEKILKAIRSHWAIENSLHWILDMSFNEDYSRIRKENAPYIMAIIRHMALNLLQHAKKQDIAYRRTSIKAMRKLCGWDGKTLNKVITTKFS